MLVPTELVVKQLITIIRYHWHSLISKCAFVSKVEMERKSSIVVISVDPAGKASFVQGSMQRRFMGQHNGKGPICLVYVSKPLMAVITAHNNSLYYTHT